MKLYRPLFSTVVILIQLILSLKDYYDLEEWRMANPELDSIISLVRHYETFFLFVLLIGVYEISIKPSWFKYLIRIFLACITLGYWLSGLIPIEDFGSGVYNTAWFSSVVAFVLILWKVVKNAEEKSAIKKKEIN